MYQDIENIIFTQLTDHNSKVFSLFSPNAHLIASAVQTQLHIWNVNLKEITHKFECDSLIDFIKWSKDSELVCCGMLKDSLQVWNLEVPHWRCKINGSLAFVNVYWAPDSRHLLVISEFHIKATVFSLVSSVVTEIDSPKAIDNCIAFSPCEKFLVVAQRLNLDDYLGIYSTDTWETVKIFPVETKDLSLMTFSPVDLMIAVLENAITEYKVLFYSLDGRMLGKYVSEVSFGITSLSWNLMMNFVAVGDCLGEVKVLDCFNFEVISSYQHPESIESADVTLFKVTENSPDIKGQSGEAISTYFELDEVVSNRPISIVPSTPDIEKGKTKNSLKCGVQSLLFSCDGKFLASINGNMSKAVFIFDTEKSKLLDVVIRSSYVKNICWHPKKPYLIICSSCNVFDMWTPKGCIRYITSFASDFHIINAAWSSAGDNIILNSREQFSLASFS